MDALYIAEDHSRNYMVCGRMIRRRSVKMSYSAVGLAISLWVAPIGMAAMAQSYEVLPARNANIWDGQDHQPTRKAISAAESAHGIGLSQKEKQAEDLELREIQGEISTGSRSGG